MATSLMHCRRTDRQMPACRLLKESATFSPTTKDRTADAHSDKFRLLAGAEEYVKGEPFFRAEFGPVYVDGSVVGPTLPLARAAYAALQIHEGKIVRAAIGTVHPDIPQTSDLATSLMH